MATVEHSVTTKHAAAPPAPSADRKLVGRIGPWQLARLISESELARVYVARPADASEDAPASYVVKVLRKEWWRDAHAIEMQRRAAWVGRKVSHPHLLPVLSAGVDLLVDLLQVIYERPDISTGSLIEHFSGREEQAAEVIRSPTPCSRTPSRFV